MIKFWLSTLKEGKSVDSPSFQNLISEILEFCSSYTKSGPGAPDAHFFYQDTRDPARVLMITGYPSLELNTEADAIYAERFLPKMFEQVQHTWLKQLDISIGEIPLGERVIVAYGKEPSSWVDGGVGGWDVWPATPQGRKIIARAQGSEALEVEDKDWVLIAGWNGQIDDGTAPKGGEKLFLRKITSR